jgi:hypothetical protein
VPIGNNYIWFVLGKCFGISIEVVSTVPLTPDYFMPSSFGLVNTFRQIFKTLGAVQSNILLNFNGQAGVDGFFMFFFLKDIIKDPKYQEERRIRSETSGQKIALTSVVKEGLKLTISEPGILIGTMGSALSIVI